MSDRFTGRHDASRRYEIRVKGHLHSRWAAWFDGLSLTNQDDGTTTIAGPIADQADLHGLLQKVRDIGLPLVSVIAVDPDQPESTIPKPRWFPRTRKRPSSCPPSKPQKAKELE